MILSWELSVYTLRHKNIGSLAGQGVCVCVFGGAVMKAEDKQGNVEQGVSPACHSTNPQWASVLPSCCLKEDIL